ncbi:MAG: hypothetical protein H6671_03665 [Anaerolineaceae bacterium]|nr:hypothetical protein [Anaerolineaceae bacterium]
MNRGFSSGLTLVTAPAGWGKTTLLAQWARENSDTTAWISLDRHDNDERRFWKYLLAAIETTESGISENLETLLDEPVMPPIETLVTTLINEIAEADAPLHLILDNYHTIESSAIHHVIAFLLEHAPENCRLVIASRTVPPLPLARMRASGSLMEIRMADLRLSPLETKALLSDCEGIVLSDDDTHRITDYTEGWITGIKLMAFALHDQPSGLFESATRYVLEYLREEILHSLPGPVQDFLVKTSVLDSLTPAACMAVCEDDNSPAMLETLERMSLVMIGHEQRKLTYRYHRIFRELLLANLRLQPDKHTQAQRRAAQWYSRQDIRKAVGHALAAGDYTYAGGMIIEQAENTWASGAISALHDWLTALPQAAFEKNATLCLLKAWTLFFTTNDEKSASDLLNTAESLLMKELHPDRGILAAVRAAYAIRREELQLAITLSQQALTLIPEDRLIWRSAVLLGLGIAHGELGDMDTAGYYLTDAVIQAEASGNPFIAIIAIYNQGRMLIHQGHLQQAAQTFQQALQRAEQSQVPFPIAGTAHIGLGHLLYEWNDLEAAADHLHTGIEQCRQLGNLEAPVRGYMNLACIKLAQKDMDEAITMNAMAEQIAQRANLKRMAERVVTHRARIWLLKGDIEAAAHWAQKSGLALADEPDFLRETDYLTLAQIAIIQGNAWQALSQLEMLRSRAEASGRIYSVIRALAVEALAWQTLDQTGRALETLERALSLAETNGFIRVFADMGKPMATLLRHAASGGILPGYVGRLLGAFGPASPYQSGANQPLIDPLSERELEVLQLIVNGLSNPEIAEELVVAMSTVKTHIKKIYRKLNVSSRTQATVRARELALVELPPASPA